MGEQLTVMTRVSRITDLGSLSSKPGLFASTLQCLHTCKQTRQDAQNAPQRGPWLECLQRTASSPIRHSEEFSKPKTEPEKLSRTQSRDSKK